MSPPGSKEHELSDSRLQLRGMFGYYEVFEVGSAQMTLVCDQFDFWQGSEGHGYHLWSQISCNVLYKRLYI